MYLKLILLLLTISICDVESNISISETDEKTVKCLLEYINSVFISAPVRLLYYAKKTDEWDEVIYNLMQFEKNPKKLIVDIVTDEMKPSTAIKLWNCTNQLLIFVDDALSLKSILEYYVKKPDFNYIIITNKQEETEEILNIYTKTGLEVKNVLARFDEALVVYYRKDSYTKTRALNVHITHGCVSLEHKVKYRYQDCVKRKIRIGTRLAIPYTDLPKKLKEDLKSNDKQIGKEIFALRIMLSDLTTFEFYDNHDFGFYNDSQDVGYGLLVDLMENKIDLLCGAIFFTKFARALDVSKPVISGRFVAIVKKRLDPRYMNLVKLIRWEVWLFLLIILTMISITAAATTYIVQFSSTTKQVDFYLFQLFTIFIGQEVSSIRKHLRLLFLSWVWLCFLVRSSYEAYTTVLFVDKESAQQVETIDEICLNNYTIYVDDYLQEYFLKGYLTNRCQIYPNTFVSVENPVRKVVEAESEFVASFIYLEAFQIYQKSEMLQGIHVVREGIGIMNFYYYTRRNHCLLKVLERRSTMMLQSGILGHMERLLETTIYRKTEKVSEKHGLAMQHIITPLCLYVIGVLCSTICFSFELVYESFRRYYKNNEIKRNNEFSTNENYNT